MLIKLSTVIAAYIVLATCAFASSNPLIIYKCTYQIERPNKPVFIMSGNIIANDATESSNEYETTYLTLAPNEMSGINVEARILILKGGYNPMKLHIAGNSATNIAYGELKEDGATISYNNSAGVSYVLQCVKR